jgi:hypothetical protein
VARGKDALFADLITVRLSPQTIWVLSMDDGRGVRERKCAVLHEQSGQFVQNI